jgi:hypothetical protein
MMRRAAVVVMVFALAGCTATQGPTVATAQRPAAAPSGPASAPTSAAPQSDYDKALSYTRCMTAHGVVTPDPVEGQPLVTVNIMHVGESEATIDNRYAAHDKCKSLLPATWPIKQDPADIARAHNFVECMRQHGQPEPEPDANGIVHEQTDDTWRSTPEYNAAFQVCKRLVDDPANNQ